MARPRAFDESDVLDRAMDVFWRLGYDGASMAELTSAMGVRSPSLYAAFGSKRGLFDSVLERYDERRRPFKEWVMAGVTARETAERMLLGAVDWLTASDEPPGCLLVQSGLTCGAESADIPAMLAMRRQRVETLLMDRFRRAQQEGDLGAAADIGGLARYLQTIFSGLCVQAAAGVEAESLRADVRLAMAAWPN